MTTCRIVSRASAASFVEELRSTGYHGRDAWLASIDLRRGTTIAAIRQLEVCASQMVSPWLDAVMDEQELWSFLNSHFWPRLLSLEEIIDGNLDLNDASAGNGDISLRNAWAGVSRQIKAARQADDQSDYGAFVTSFVVSVMVLRQLIEPRESNSASDCFVCESSNLARAFLSQCFAKAGFTPFEASDGSSLHRLAAQMHTTRPLARQ